MPELPEVETVKESLKPRLLHRKITKVKIYHNNIIAYPKVDKFISNITNQEILDITRRGKFIVFELNNYYLFFKLFFAHYVTQFLERGGNCGDYASTLLLLLLCRVIEQTCAEAALEVVSLQHIVVYATLAASPKLFVVCKLGEWHRFISKGCVYLHNCQTCCYAENLCIRVHCSG